MILYNDRIIIELWFRQELYQRSKDDFIRSDDAVQIEITVSNDGFLYIKNPLDILIFLKDFIRYFERIYAIFILDYVSYNGLMCLVVSRKLAMKRPKP